MEERIERLENDYAEMREILVSLHNRIDSLLKLAEESFDTEIKNLEDAYAYEDKVKRVFEEIGIKGIS